MTRFRPAAVAAAVTLAVGLLFAPSQAQPGGKKYAVLVGVKAYDHAKLNNLDYPENDVDALRDLLAKHGYDVTLLSATAGRTDPKLDPTLANIDARLGEVLRRCKRDDTMIVALAGHGLEFEKQAPDDPDDAYFCPRDARPFRDERESLLSLKALYKKLDKSGAGVKLLLVDACRNDPMLPAGARRGTTGSTAPRPPEGVAALFSCKGGEFAQESHALKHGVFFHYVLEGLRGKAKDADGDVTWDGLQSYVRTRVSKDVAAIMKSDVRQTPTLNAGELAGLPPVLVTVGGEVQVNDANTYTSKTTGMKFVRIKAGTFTMGSPRVERGLEGDEVPHEVTLTKDFYLGVYEVTQKEWRAVMGTTPWQGTDNVKEGDDYPATYVSWDDAVSFARKLGEADGVSYRLPTEAEWEYACRAGSKASYGFGDDPAALSDHGWYGKNTDDAGEKYAHRVGQKRANGFGLYDLHGNVKEWCGDWFGDYPSGRVTDPTNPSTGSFRVYRGGDWGSSPRYCRSAFRLENDPSVRSGYLGFRLALVPSGR